MIGRVGKGDSVGWGNGVSVTRADGVLVGVRVTPVDRLNRPKVRIEAATMMNSSPATPPITHGSQSESFFFFVFNLKSDGTETRMTVMLS